MYDTVTVSQPSPAEVVVEWDANPVSDMIADSVMACIAQTHLNAAAVKGRPMCVRVVFFICDSLACVE